MPSSVLFPVLALAQPIPDPAPIQESISCFCVTYIRQFRPDLPRQDAKDFVPNASPKVGAIAIHRYWSKTAKEWIYHVGYIAEIKDGGWVEYGSNLMACKPYVRFMKVDDSLVGFWD